jgi:hypothetical protein
VPKQGDRVLVTIGKARRPFACPVCGGTVFTAYKVRLNTAVAYRIGDQFGEQAISLICASCGYIHTFIDGSLEVWAYKDGYPEAPGQVTDAQQQVRDA